ncbi:hypothetical protein JJL45_05260 [Tamlana sp. s12]|uniref:hypothetical protein n=1 Tax=Tamlana sp. s12 TaxID=1630406 RepID=UPI0007FBBB31|nr:hypothetical protein [Tamlana sp. s12]OBQ56087.1 hypothetical protein VQ01_06800 [Tamlana sp. s12]QQY83400.1 hypothetical protein JJL45_05260 [Tamlana sp. s12]
MSSTLAQRLTQRRKLLAALASDNLQFYVVDENDKTDSPEGSSFRVEKEELVKILGLDKLESNINSIQFEGIKSYQTLSDLQAIPVPDDGTAAKVVNDPTASNNGYYTVSSDSWVQDSRLTASVVDPNDEGLGVNGKGVFDYIKVIDSKNYFLNNFQNLIESGSPVYPFDYFDMVGSLPSVTIDYDGTDFNLVNSNSLPRKITTGWDVTGLVDSVELFCEPTANEGFGFSLNLNGSEVYVLYRNNGQILVQEEGSGSSIASPRGVSSYTFVSGDKVSLSVTIINGHTEIKTSVNGVYSPEVYLSDDYEFAQLNYALRSGMGVKNPYFFFEKKSVQPPLDIIYVNDSDGDDSYIGKFPFVQPSGGGRLISNGPVKTITEALTRGSKNIIIVEGTYEDETDLSITDNINISTYSGGQAVIDLSEKHAGTSFTQNSTHSNIYQLNVAETVIACYENDYEGWLYSRSSLADCAANQGSFYYSAGVLYVYPVANISTINIVIPSIEGLHFLNRSIDGVSKAERNASIINIFGVTQLYSKGHGFSFEKGFGKIVRCKSYGSETNGFYFNGSFFDVSGCTSSFNDGDGFNIHAFDEENAGYVVFNNCEAISNFGVDAGNDGISFHENSKGEINGGVYINNTKFDVVHVNRAEVEHKDFVCGSLEYQINGNAYDVFHLNISNIIASGIMNLSSNVSTVIINISNCKASEINLRGTGVVNGSIYKNRCGYMQLLSNGTREIQDNKVKNGTGVRIDSGDNYLDGNSILNNTIGIRKEGGIATMGTNNLYGNNSDYTGTDIIDPTEQAKNVSYLEI